MDAGDMMIDCNLMLVLRSVLVNVQIPKEVLLLIVVV